MADIGVPFCFVKPARDGSYSLSIPSYLVTRSRRTPTATSFSYYLRLPFELRREIMKITIDDARSVLEEWRGKQGGPLVVQSRRGVFRLHTQHEGPPGLSQFACISREWKEEVEEKLFKKLCLRAPHDYISDEATDLAIFSTIVTGPRRRYLRRVKLELHRDNSALMNRQFARRNDGPPCADDGYKSIIRLLHILGAWTPDALLTVKLNIALQEFSFIRFQEDLIYLPVVPVIGKLHINMAPDEFSKLPLALPQLLRKVPRLKIAVLHLSSWCCSTESEKNSRIQCRHMHIILTCS